MTPIEAVDFMRRNKIVSFKTPDGLEITLSPDALAPPAPEAKPEQVDGPEMDEVGSAGMTRREQIDLFGRTFEADFQKRK